MPDRRRVIRLLVVDDHDLVAESLQRALAAKPGFFVVGGAGSAESALAEARRLRPDVVLMGSRLPDGTGAAATGRLKAELPDTEVVMLGADSSGASVAEALEAGCSGFVAKDGRFDDLVRTIRAVMDGEVRVPPSVVDDLAAHLRPRSSTLGADLTPREREVLALLAKGRSTNQMVDDLVVSVHTVRNHIRNILTKLQARSRLEAVAIAIRLGLVETDEQVGARRA